MPLKENEDFYKKKVESGEEGASEENIKNKNREIGKLRASEDNDYSWP